MKKIYLFLYYAFLQYIPMQLMPGYKIGYALRRWVVKCILGDRCGKDVIVKDRCYFGNGGRLIVGDVTIGNNVQIAANAFVNRSIPDNCVVMGNPAKIVKKDGKVI